jgi:SAM-dependent methyltransferase
MQFLNRLLRYANSVRLLNRTRHNVDNLQASIGELFEVIHGLNAELQSSKGVLAEYRSATNQAIAAQSDALAAQSNALAKQIAAQSAAQSDALAAQSNALAKQSELSSERIRIFDHKVASIAAGLDMLSRAGASQRTESLKSSPPPELSLLLDTFYVALENRFRGDVADIGQRQSVYLPDIEQALNKLDNKMVLDLGCGRGEWLSLLRSHGIEGLGVDTNEGQLAAARENGLAVYNEDGLQFLRSQSEGRFAAVTAFHIFEHLPFAVLAEWLLEIRRVLCPGGILIAETPNPENLIVGANTFHLDPTHTRPLPSGILAILSETVGLAVKQIRPLHPHGDLAAALKDLPERTAYLLYGYQDYGLIVERPLKGTA